MSRAQYLQRPYDPERLRHGCFSTSSAICTGSTNCTVRHVPIPFQSSSKLLCIPLILHTSCPTTPAYTSLVLLSALIR